MNGSLFWENIDEDLRVIKSVKEICERNLKGSEKVKKRAWKTEGILELMELENKYEEVKEATGIFSKR